MRNQRTHELRIYRHRKRRHNKWRRESPTLCSNPLPAHNSTFRRAPIIIECEKEILRRWQNDHGYRLWRIEERFALKLFSKHNMAAAATILRDSSHAH